MKVIETGIPGLLVIEPDVPEKELVIRVKNVDASETITGRVVDESGRGLSGVKLGVLVGSLISAATGLLVLHLTLPRKSAASS